MLEVMLPRLLRSCVYDISLFIMAERRCLWKTFPVLRLSPQPLPRVSGIGSRSEQPLSPSPHISYSF